MVDIVWEHKLNLILMNSQTSMSAIAKFYRGKTVVVSGATGFIGKALVEKILRSCPEVKNVCCLVRTNIGQDPEERLAQMRQQPVKANNAYWILATTLYYDSKTLFIIAKYNYKQIFDDLNVGCNDVWKKVRCMKCDVLEKDLGMSNTDRRFLQENANVFFNTAGSVNFKHNLRWLGPIHIAL